jgi:hypothetical protein
MAFIKHVGKHNNRKVVVVFREIPTEEHMALVVYTETLPSHIHDAIIETVESNLGQSELNLGDALDRKVLNDGRNLLRAIHNEGFMKKVQTSQVIMMPTAKSSVRLDELNRVLNDLAAGGDAAKKLAEMDKNAGLVDPTAKKAAEEIIEANNTVSNTNVDPMSDEGIASTMIEQANKMAAEAKGLAAESERMLNEAYAMAPSLKPAATKKSTTKKVTVEAADLSSMTKTQLLEHAKANGIPGNASMSKAAILEAITSKQ